VAVGAAVIWIITLALILFGVTPPLLVLCYRLVIASRSIDRLFQETLKAAEGVAAGTQHVGALEETIAVAGGMLPVAAAIHDHTGTIEHVLIDRLKRGG
jgi:hypothetical protein